MAIEAVVFDIGNVLIEWHPERYYDARIGAARRKELFDDVDLIGMNVGIDLGAEFRSTIYEMAEKHPEWRDEIRLWHDNWIDIASPAIDHSVKLLRALRARKFPVFALTNFGIGSFDHAETFYPFFAEFDRRYISGHLEVVKPDPRIYQIVEEDCRVAPSNLLFTDDSPANISEANARGWQTHLFEDPQGWADRLVSEGLLSPDEAAQ